MKNSNVVLSLIVLLTAELALSQSIDPRVFSRKATLTVSGYSGGTLTDYPLLVKLGPNLSGFAYSDFAYPATGADMRFTDAAGNLLPHEIDTWKTNGTSLVWVKVPSLASGTAITLYYGSATIPSRPDSREVWSRYAAVYHLASSNDATANALNAYAGKMNYYIDETPLGTCRNNSGYWGWFSDHYQFHVPAFDGFLADASQLGYSGWFKFVAGTNILSANTATNRLFSRTNLSTSQMEVCLNDFEFAIPNLVVCANNSKVVLPSLPRVCSHEILLFTRA